MERSSATLDEIARVSGIEKSLARESLVSAIQHNFVLGVEEEKATSKSDQAPVVVTNYRIIMENALVRVRFAKYITLAGEKFSKEAEEVVMIVLRDGRGTVDTITRGSELFQGDEYSKQCVLDAIRVLRDHKFLMAVPEANTNPTLPCRSKSCIDLYEEEDPDAPTGRGRKRSHSGTVLAKKTGATSEGAAGSPSGKAKRVAKVSGRPKKSSANAKKTAHLAVAPEMRIYEDPSAGESSSFGAAGTAGSNTAAGSSMAVDEPLPTSFLPLPATASSASASSTIPSAIALEGDTTKYCLDYDRFNAEFAKDACIAFVGEKIDAIAASIMREMFEISESSRLVSEDRLYFNMTNPENPKFNPILAKVPKERVKQYLDLMSKDKTQMLIKQTMGFAVNHKSILDHVKQKLVESVVLDKFGPDSLRIFRLLIMKNMLEQKQVSELAMTPIKDTRDCLYKMLQHNYVYLQEVPRTNEHNPSKTFYLWTVRMHQVRTTLLGDMYKAIRNMRFRLAHTLQTHADLFAKRDEEERIQQDTPKYSRLTDADHELLAELASIEERLDVSVLHIDESIMTLEDY